MQHRIVPEPPGLRRLLRSESDKRSSTPSMPAALYSRTLYPMAAPAMRRNLDIEGGITDASGGGDGGHVVSDTTDRPKRRARDNHLARVALLVETLVILGLIAILARDRARARHGTGATAAGDWMDGFPDTGPRVTFVSIQKSKELNHLIMVPCHGVTVTESLDGADNRDADWFLLDYQKGKDVPRALVGHIQGGLEELHADKNALLLFSGGKTRGPAGPKSEGESYFFVADHYNWWGRPELRARASTEDFARDSFENLLFSICRFKEVTGSYPTKITIVGFDFKEERFDTLHGPAVRFPPEAFRYVGQRPGGRFDHDAAVEGERVSALEPYRLDPYGCAAGGKLAAKRQERDPFHRTPPYGLVCPEMSELLEYCGTALFSGDLPWSPGDGDGMGEIPGTHERL